MTKQKTYPDNTVAEAAREAGAVVACLWQMPGPKNTNIAWMEALAINGSVCIVQTYENGGWEAYTHARSPRIDETVADVLERCGIAAKPEA